MNIEGLRVFITGASSGLGEALARELTRRGAECALAARRLDRLEALADELKGAVPVACDVTDRAGVAAAVEEAVRHMGGIDLLINNAGVSAYGRTERMSDGDLAEILAVNFQGAVNGMQAVLPLMRRQGAGRIVNIASLAALHGVPYLAAYGASKAALAAYSQSLRAELAPTGIGIQVIYPDYIQTPLFGKELKLGGARRPGTPYATAQSVARLIVREIERGKPEVVLGSRGRLMAILRGAMPRVLERTMCRLAARLRDKEERCHA